MLWWTSHSWKNILEALAFLGLSELKPARAPASCVWGGFFSLSLNWNIFSLELKLCQRVQGPWHEWYWNSNESPTGGLFTWSHILGPPNRGIFFATNVSVWSQLTQCAGIRWYTVSQCRNAFDLLVNGDSALCSDCFVPALCLYAHTVDINPRSLFSV